MPTHLRNLKSAVQTENPATPADAKPSPGLSDPERWVELYGDYLFKFALVAGLARVFGASPGVSLRTGLALAQAGEWWRCGRLRLMAAAIASCTT